MQPSSFKSHALPAARRKFHWRGGTSARFLAGIAVVGTGSLLLGHPAQAQTPYTDSASGTTTFSAAISPAVPGSGTSYINGDTLTFSNTATSTQTDDLTAAQALNFNALIFSNSAALTLNTGTNNNFIILGATSGGTAPTVTMSNSGTVTNNLSTILAANTTFMGNGSATFAGVISGSGFGITKTGNGTLVLTGANTYTGATTITSGTLQLGDGTAGHDGSIGSTPAILDNAALAFNTNSTQSYGGTIDGSGSLTKTGTGSLTLSSANFYTGNTTVSGAGTLLLTNSQALQNSALQSGGTGLSFSSSVYNATAGSSSYVIGGLNGGTTLALADNGGNAVALTLHPKNGSTDTYNSAITGAGSLTVAGTGNQILGGTNTYTGGTTVSLGTLTLDFNQTNAPASNILYNGVTQTAAQTLVMGGVGASTNNDLAPGANLTVNGKSGGTSTQTFYGLTLNPGLSNVTLTPNGGGSVQLNFTNGLTHNTGGLINFTDTQSATNFISLGNGTSTGTLNDATGIIGGYATVNGTAYASVNGIGQVVPYTYTTTVGLNGAIADSGAGTETNVQLNGAASTGAGVTLSGTGVTNINTLTNAGTGAQTLTIGSGNTLRLGANGGILQGSGQSLTIGTNNVGTLTAGGNAYGTAGEISLVARNSSSVTINSVIANNNASTGTANSTGGGAVTLTIGDTQNSGTDYVQLNGNNTYSGGTYLEGSRVKANTTTAFGTGPVTVLPGSQANLSAGGTFTNQFNIAGTGLSDSFFFGALRLGGNTVSGNINLLGDATVGTNQGSAVITGNLTGTGSLNVDIVGGTSVLTLGGASTTDKITGNLTINGFAPGVPAQGTYGGTVKLGGTTVLPDALVNSASTGNVIINGQVTTTNGGNNGNQTLDLNGFSASTNGIISTGPNVLSSFITNSGNSAVLTIGDNNANAIFGGKITDSGTGKTLGITKAGTGTQTFTGVNTYIGATTINGGTLAVNGSTAAGSAVAVNNSGTLTGTGTAAGAVMVASGGTLNAGGVGTVGTFTTGADTFGAGSSLVFDFGNNNVDELFSTGLVSNLSNSAFTFTQLTGSTGLTNSSYTLVSAASFSDSNLPTNVSNTPAGYQLQFSGNNLNLVQIAAAPEPSQWVALLMGALGLGGLSLKARRRAA